MSKQSLPHTATATWSGFIYQGRVGLYHILTQLNAKTDAEIDELFFQIDSIEDFTIHKYDSKGAIVPVTMHQVKAVKSDTYSTYKEDFKQLERKWKAIGNPSVKAFFHLSSKNEKTKAQIEVLHPNLLIYQYDNDESCSLIDVEVKIKEQIALLLQKCSLPGHDNPSNLQLLSEVLEKLVSNKVVYIHSLNHGGVSIRNAAYENPISLRDFLNAVKTDLSSLVQNETYFEGKIRGNLNRYYQEYCFEIADDELLDIVKQKLNKYLLHFNSLDSQRFKIFLQKIRPHKRICFSSLIEYTDGSIIEDEIKDAFLNILTHLKNSNNNNGIGWIGEDLKNYYPTSITESNSEAGKARISRKILDNSLSTLIEIPFDFDYLITSECNVDSIQQSANKISEIEELQPDKIVNWRNISLIDLDAAKQKLNE